MKRSWKQELVALVAGLLFGVGLAVSGMTKPAKVIGFLDLLGKWDASLMFVMVGAIGINFLAYRIVLGRSTPWLTSAFALPTRRDVDLKLVAGAALFGVGWGMGGFCPGPSLVSLASGTPQIAGFVAALLAGMFAAGRLDAWLTRLARTRSQRQELQRKRSESAA